MRVVVPLVVLCALVAGTVSGASKPDTDRPPALPFIEDDFNGAMVSAKATGRPIFVEVWAPW